MKIKPTTFSTSDFMEVCFILANNKPLLRTEQDGQRVTFYFDNSDGYCSQLVQQFRKGDDRLSVNQFRAAEIRVRQILKASQAGKLN